MEEFIRTRQQVRMRRRALFFRRMSEGAGHEAPLYVDGGNKHTTLVHNGLAQLLTLQNQHKTNLTKKAIADIKCRPLIEPVDVTKFAVVHFPYKLTEDELAAEAAKDKKV